MQFNDTMLKVVLTDLYNKICTCIRDDKESEDLLNPCFHREGCLYRLAVEKEKNIVWKKEEPTQTS